MYCLTVNLTSDEWLKIQQAAAKQWPSETLSYAEIVRLADAPLRPFCRLALGFTCLVV
jgi:hypothetical protein